MLMFVLYVYVGKIVFFLSLSLFHVLPSAASYSYIYNAKRTRGLSAINIQYAGHANHHLLGHRLYFVFVFHNQFDLPRKNIITLELEYFCLSFNSAYIFFIPVYFDWSTI